MSDPNPPEQPSFNRPAGSDPTAPLPSGGAAAPGAGSSATPPPPPAVPPAVPPAGSPGVSSGVSSGSSPVAPPPVPPAGGQGGPSGLSSLPDPAREGAGFFTALFDFSFTNFVTPILVRFVYVLATVALVVMWLVFLVTGFATSLGAGLLALVLGPVLLIIYLAIVRMTLEFYLSVVRMSQDIHKRLPQA